MEGFGRGRNHSRKQGESRGRSKSQSRPQRDMRNVKCFYCREIGHVHTRCAQMRDDLKKLKGMKKDDGLSQTNVARTIEDDDDMFLATTKEVVKSK